MGFFRSNLYWNFNLTLLWLDLALVIYFIGKELFEKIKTNKNLALLLLIIPLIMVLPIGPKYFSNSFMHENIAREFSKNKFAKTQCLWYSEDGCKFRSFPPWTYAYHILLSNFVMFGITGIKFLNAIMIFLFFFFGYLSMKINNSSKSALHLLAFALPQMLVFSASPNLDLSSLAIGMVFFYFANKKRARESVALGAYLIHIRPETLIYIILMGLPVLKEWSKDKVILGFGGANLVLKMAEYFRGSAFTPEWGLNLQTRLQQLPNLIPNLLYLLNPSRFNLIFSGLVLLGVFKLVKRKKFGAASLPLLALFIYTTHPHVNFATDIIDERYILGWVFASLPAFFEGLNGKKISTGLLMMALIPFAFTDFSENTPFQNFDLAQTYQIELAEISNTNSMPIYTFAPYIFENKADAVFIVDDSPYPTGNYLLFNTRNETNPNAKYFGHINNELFLFNFSIVE